MIDWTSELGKHAAKRLEQEQVIWIVTVGADGTPQPNPVWFSWEKDEVLIYTPPGSAKLSHIKRHPQVALHFEGAELMGGDVVVFKGMASLESGAPQPDPHYVAKYTLAAQEWGRTVEDLYREYSVAVRVKLEKVRGF